MWETHHPFHKTNVFLLSFIADLPLVFLGAALTFIGNIILTELKPDFFTVTIGGSLIIFGLSMAVTGLIEPIVRFLSRQENIVNCPFCSVRYFVLHPEVHIEGVKLADTDYKKIIEGVIKDESGVIGVKASRGIAKRAGLEINEKGQILKSPDTPLKTLEELINSYISNFGRITFLPIQLILSNYPNIELKPQIGGAT